jgi:hypothetical protein
MSVPSTREPQKTPVSQITHGPNAVRFACSRKVTAIQGRILKRRTRIFRWPEHKSGDGRVGGS